MKTAIFRYLSYTLLFASVLKEIFPIQAEIISPTSSITKETKWENYPHLSKEMQQRISPYLISSAHPLKPVLDDLFGKKRITRSKNDFIKAGFKIVDERPRSFVIVARHLQLKDHLVKCYFDTENREKKGRASWKWLVDRCRGAKKLAQVIKKHQIKHFDVAKKWIYLQPLLDKKPPFKEFYTRHPALLLVTDMKLVPMEKNLYAWKHLVTKEMLKELYVVITESKGSSYRADNIAYSSHFNKFCFIDSEYPSHGPDYSRIGHYLNSEMKAYWYGLVKKGDINILE